MEDRDERQEEQGYSGDPGVIFGAAATCGCCIKVRGGTCITCGGNGVGKLSAGDSLPVKVCCEAETALPCHSKSGMHCMQLLINIVGYSLCRMLGHACVYMNHGFHFQCSSVYHTST